MISELKKVLLVAFHYPPCGGGSGVHRAVKFSTYLPQHGWKPYVLTVSRWAHKQTDDRMLADVSPEVSVTHAFALDAQRQLSFRGRYFGWSSLPDRWANWIAAAIPAGLYLIYRNGIDVIVVTFPITTSVLIALILHRLTGKPLVVDFRDSMTEDTYPADPFVRRIWRRIEKAVMQRGSRFIFTTRSAREMYLKRYPHLLHRDCLVIPNGYDESDFEGVAPYEPASGNMPRPIRIVHSGLVYPEERDPRPFFVALRRLKDQQLIDSDSLRVEFRASGSESYYTKLLQDLGISDIVHLLPLLPHRSALQDIAQADALMLIQAASCDHQIPAKAYEYFRAARPILALVSLTGDTADLLRTTGGATLVDLTDEAAISETLLRFMEAVRSGSHPLPNERKVRSYARKAGAEELARCLDALIFSEAATSVSLRETH
jgi:glycosyltransferase involved in cell wall biosynthesis